METLEELPQSRKRQHSRSRSKSPSENVSEQNSKKKRLDHEINEPKRTETTSNAETTNSTAKVDVMDVKNGEKNVEKSDDPPNNTFDLEVDEKSSKSISDKIHSSPEEKSAKDAEANDSEMETKSTASNSSKLEENSDNDIDDDVMESEKLNESVQLSSDSDDDDSTTDKETKEATKSALNTELNTPSKKLKQDSPKKKLTPKQVAKRQEKEKRRQERQKELEERKKKKQEEKERFLQEKLKKRELKEKELEEKKKEKEEKRRKEQEEKDQKRKEKEEKEEQKRKEREQEKQKKLQEIEEKNKEKQKEEEKKQKAAAAFVNFFVAKKTEEAQEERKIQSSNFLQFEVKSDMKLPLARREPLSEEDKKNLETYLVNQNEDSSYLKDLSSGKPIGKCLKTWPYEEPADDDVIVVDLGETIYEDKSSLQRHKAKFLYFHDNRRPAYYGTWRKKSNCVTSRKPFEEDKEILNYEEDSDDDWEEEEQGESLNGSDDEVEKENENEDEKDDYEVDNDFFVPHGHLSDDEVDDEEMARLSPESLKQKLKLLKEEFDQEMNSKTHKLKPRSIGCIWYNRDGSNVEEAIDRYLQPLAVITRHTQIVIKSRIDIANLAKERSKFKNWFKKDLEPEMLSSLLKRVHGSSKKKSTLVEEFLADLQKSEASENISKTFLIRKLKQCAIWEKYKDEESNRYRFRWTVHEDLREKFDLTK